MYRLSCIILIFLTIFPLLTLASERGTKTITGEVVFVDQKERTILVKKMVGKHEYINGGIVDDNTHIMISGKKGSLEEIKVKDRVTLIMTIKDEDVYVTKIIKK
ncbi:MAG TPA: hypothetical protein PKW07_00805 [Syntrophorhabdaceae bacterium]|mgnify:CR=1 FL=1|nr:hypothetical protein [Syntrophorhabdaceae bacterium]